MASASPVTATPTPSLIAGLRLGGKKAAIFGDGQIAASRAVFALDAGADVVLFTSEAPESLAKWVDAGRLRIAHSSTYRPTDMSNFSVVFVIGGTQQQAIARDARAAGVLVNVASNAELSDFTLMPTYRGSSSLQIAVTTNGVAPRVASRLLTEIVGKLPADLEPQLKDVARLNHVAREAERQRDKMIDSIELGSGDISTAETATNTPPQQTSSPGSVNGIQSEDHYLDLATLRDSKNAQSSQAINVQTAVSYVAHALSDLCFVYSAPEQEIGEAALAWSRRAEKNAFGEWVSALRMQTRHGAGHALWGALSSGSRVAAVASAESLPYMVPVLAELVARKQPIVIHAAAQSLDEAVVAQTDFADAFVALGTNAVFLASASAQEAHDVALIAHAVAHTANLPVVHLVNGAQDAAESVDARISNHQQLTAFVAAVDKAIKAADDAQPANVIQLAFAQFKSVFGRTYRPLEYTGSADAETVFVSLGQTAGTVQAALPAILKERNAGVLNVRTLRPWDVAQFLASLPSTTRRLVVLSSSGDHSDPLTDALNADVSVAAFVGNPASPIRVIYENLYGFSQDAVANTMRTVLGLEKIALPESEETTDGQRAPEAAPQEDVSLAATEPAAFHDDALAVAKRVVFPEAYDTKLAARPGEKTFMVKVSSLRRMTPETYDRNIIHIEFDTRGTDLTYEIGDALGVYGFNDAAQVRAFCAQYGLDGDQLVTATRDGQSQTRSVQSWLTHALDLFGRPSKKFYTALADFATNEKEAEKLRWLTTSEGSAEFKDRVADTTTYADLLNEFTSARPSFLYLVDLIAPIKPRHYSIASSAKMHPGSVHLCVVTVEWKNSKGELRMGQCTRFLNSLNIGDEIVVSVKPSVMKLPPLDSQPVIMAGLGTGMAPFRAFIEERAVRKLQGVDVGPMTLYFGSRHRAMEYLYGEEFEAYHADGLLSGLQLAFSRDQKAKVYIQHKMREDAELLASQMLKQDGCFYLCGPTWPTGDVKDAMVSAFTTFGSVKPGDANRVIEELKESERYTLEVY
ncbi:sulfite reductase [NADPH] flavoprotein component [Coemansia guatemalensis]|uniref:assimilatory sulfite reductase (NADPH) n=1 Tax=Coemansia guatemalensis TaxID=2761395 RepID=A0A9W8I175_9FUNG|nr:sulfite reductase [NADPH] flavoprotein component [Coemansia guatemalensis]